MQNELSIQQDSPAMDYFSLLQESIRQLARLTGSEWTDFNEHDPGITILEQLCYALSDLSYRIDFPLPDLLSEDGAQPYASLYPPAQILTSRPVTLMDLRKLVVDVEGVKNAWIEPLTAELDPGLYFQKQALVAADHTAQLADASNLLYFANSTSETVKAIKTDGAVALHLKGLLVVLIEKYPEANESEVVKKVTARIHAQRSLALDFYSIEVLKPQAVQIKASIEITLQGDPDAIYSAVLQKITDYLSPSVKFYSLEQRLAANLAMEDIFDGPRLTQGFIDTEELAKIQRKTSLRTSDLIHAIMDVEGVRLVKYLVFMNQGQEVPWVLELDANKVPILDFTNLTLTLRRNQLSLKVSPDILNTFSALSAEQNSPVGALEPIFAIGRNRQVGRYTSIQHQFPVNYGVGATGLPLNATDIRLAQANQLKAYLLFFDQILANNFNQLAHLSDLFGFDDSPLSSYFMDFIEDSSLGWDSLWMTKNASERKTKLQNSLENPKIDTDLQRKNRFLDHLLARFAEPFTDSSRFQDVASPLESSPLAKIAQDKVAILRHYPEISAGRGTAYDVTQVWSENNRAGLEQRLRLKLLGKDASEQLYLLEHILLRPVDSDKDQAAPVLALANRGYNDPYSLQISLVFSGSTPRFNDVSFKQYIAQSVREETPAHLMVYIIWLTEENARNDFQQSYQNWQMQQRNYRLGFAQENMQFKYRDARDSLIFRLNIGNTYPLTDLPLSQTLTVVFDTPAVITLFYTQKGVSYQLYDKHQNAIGTAIEGNADKITLTTMAIQEDSTFSIQASKKTSGEKNLTVVLTQTVAVKVGLNTALAAQIVDAPLLDASSDARIVNYAASVQVEILASQQGVDYSLIDELSQSTLSVAEVKGTLETITLTIEKVTEDIQIRVRAKKVFDSALNRPDEIKLLDKLLSLKVRANPALAFSITPAVLDYKSGANLVIKNSQATVSYQILSRPIFDSEFIRVFTPEQTAWSLDSLQMSEQWVSNPPTDLVVLDNAVTGNGGDLVLPVTAQTEDSVMVIQARKSHTIEHSQSVLSSIELTQRTALLVQPGTYPDFTLRLITQEIGVVAAGSLQKGLIYSVVHGQPGVFYYFRLANNSENLGLPVYFHKAGKGINQLRVEIDFTLIDHLPTPPPEWECPMDLDAGTQLSIRAVKAQTALEVIYVCTVADLFSSLPTG